MTNGIQFQGGESTNLESLSMHMHPPTIILEVLEVRIVEASVSWYSNHFSRKARWTLVITLNEDLKLDISYLTLWRLTLLSLLEKEQ